MRKLKLIGIALMAFVVCAGFTACSSDDDDESSSGGITGVWEVPGDNEILVLEKDGTYRYYVGYGNPKTRGDLGGASIEITFGTYVLTENTITLNKTNKYTYLEDSDELKWYGKTSGQEVWEYTLSDGKLHVETEDTTTFLL